MTQSCKNVLLHFTESSVVGLISNFLVKSLKIITCSCSYVDMYCMDEYIKFKICSLLSGGIFSQFVCLPKPIAYKPKNLMYQLLILFSKVSRYFCLLSLCNVNKNKVIDVR